MINEKCQIEKIFQNCRPFNESILYLSTRRNFYISYLYVIDRTKSDLILLVLKLTEPLRYIDRRTDMRSYFCERVCVYKRDYWKLVEEWVQDGTKRREER